MRCFVLFAAAKSNGETIVPSARILRRFHSRARINTNEFNRDNDSTAEFRGNSLSIIEHSVKSRCTNFKMKFIKFLNRVYMFFMILKCCIGMNIFDYNKFKKSIIFFKIYYIPRNS